MRPIYALGLMIIGVALVIAPAAVFYLMIHGGRIPAWLPTGPWLVRSAIASEAVGFILILLSRNHQGE
jgi:hypothetical protein